MKKFFMSLWICLFRLLPEPKKVDWLELPEDARVKYQGYSSWHFRQTESIVLFYKSELYRIDPDYKLHKDSEEVVKQRNIAREAGIDPMSPDYPTLDSIRNPSVESQ